jgi:glucosamine-6-phosphate deaminase
VKRGIQRGVALIVVGCILVDPLMAAGPQTVFRFSTVSPCPHEVFAQQAFVQYLLSFTRPAFGSKASKTDHDLGSAARTPETSNTIRPGSSLNKPFNYLEFLKDTEEPRFKQGFSGLRTTFGTHLEDINPNDLLAISMYGYFYAQNRIETLERPADKPIELVMAEDPRPSRKAIQEALLKGIQAAAEDFGHPVRVKMFGILTTPLLESAIRTLGADGGIMLTASHNPLKDNGIKFMSAASEGRGAVLAARKMDRLILQFKTVRKRSDWVEPMVVRFAEQRPSHTVFPTVTEIETILKNYIHEFKDFFGDAIAGLLDASIIIDVNGGAGAVHILKQTKGVIAWILQELGMNVREVNADLGVANHSLEPSEGSDGVVQMQTLLNSLLSSDPQLFAILFDWDADRGTTAPYMDPQDVAIFNIAMTLSWMDAYHKADRQPVVIVASEFTSQRAEDLAHLFSREDRPVRVRRVETGEINVVTAMEQERRKGAFVPIGVEGASGGTVLGLATCRDGIATAILTALALKDRRIRETWSRHVSEKHSNGLSNPAISLHDLVATIPGRKTYLGAKTDVAVSIPFLKQRMENEFRHEWAISSALRHKFPEYHISHFEEDRQYTRVTGEGQGGWTLNLTQTNGEKSALKLRPSRTQAAGTAALVRYQVEAPDDASFSEASELFETLYKAANQPSEERTDAHAQTEILFEQGLSFSYDDDVHNQDWENSRMHKRADIHAVFPLEWKNPVRVNALPESVRMTLDRLVERRQRWHQEQISPNDSDYAEWTSREKLAEHTLDASLEFVMDELLANAFDAYVRAAKIDGQITIRVVKQGNWFKMDVSDNGIGIQTIYQTPGGQFDVLSLPSSPEADLSKIEGGKQIALLWIHILVQARGGSLQFFSPGLNGAETTVRLTLPSSALYVIPNEELPVKDFAEKAVQTAFNQLQPFLSNFNQTRIFEILSDIYNGRVSEHNALHALEPYLDRTNLFNNLGYISAVIRQLIDARTQMMSRGKRHIPNQTVIAEGQEHPVKILIAADGNEVGRLAADWVAGKFNGRQAMQHVLGLPTDRTSLPMYKELIRKVKEERLNLSKAITFLLDEFLGLEPGHPASFRTRQEKTLDALGIPVQNRNYLDGTTADPDAEGRRYEGAIERAGGLGSLVLGLSEEGHIAFMEVGSTLKTPTGPVELRPKTREANAGAFGGDVSKVPTHGLSMSIAALLKARQVILLVAGEAKAQAVNLLLNGPIGAACPASFLRYHPDFTLIADYTALRLAGLGTIAPGTAYILRRSA